MMKKFLFFVIIITVNINYNGGQKAKFKIKIHLIIKNLRVAFLIILKNAYIEESLSDENTFINSI